jgi:CO/xanthine dehydrogenase Mo-binding subunit
LLTASFMDYAMPRAADLPRFDVVMREVPTQANPLGVKGAGQAGCIGAPQTIVAAILDALRPLGVTHIDMPATPRPHLAGHQSGPSTQKRVHAEAPGWCLATAWPRG